MKLIWTVIWIGGIVLGIVFGVLLLVWAIYSLGLIWTGGIVFVALLLVLAIYPLRRIRPTETGVFVFFERVRKVRESGLYFWFRPFGEVIRFPITQMRLEYEVVKPITKKGRYYPQYQKVKKQLEQLEKTNDVAEREKYKTILDEMKGGTFKKEKEKEKEGGEVYEYEYEECESIEIDKVGMAVYLKYPGPDKPDKDSDKSSDKNSDKSKGMAVYLKYLGLGKYFDKNSDRSRKKNLTKTLQTLGRPKNEKELTEHFRGFVIGCLRDVLGGVEWRVAVENREHIAKEMKKRFKEDNSPFMTAGFQPEDIYVALTIVDIPQTLTRLLSLPQEEFLKARAAEKEADKRATETVGTVIQMMAKARGKEPKVIQEEIEKQPDLKKEFLALSKDLVVRKLGIEGQSYLDIHVQGAKGIERAILNILAAWKRMPMGSSAAEEPTVGEPPTPAEAVKTTEPEKEDIEKQINKLVAKRRLTGKEWDKVLKLIGELPGSKGKEVNEQIVRLAKEGKIRVI